MENIYFADDDPDDREIFAELFYKMFPLAELRLFENGAELMRSLYQQTDPLPYLILLDLKMPLKDGFECLKEIRSRSGDFKNSKVVIFSASGTPCTVERVFGLGADFYAVKPVVYGELKSLIQKIMEIDWEAPRARHEFRLS